MHVKRFLSGILTKICQLFVRTADRCRSKQPICKPCHRHHSPDVTESVIQRIRHRSVTDAPWSHHRCPRARTAVLVSPSHHRRPRRRPLSSPGDRHRPPLSASSPAPLFSGGSAPPTAAVSCLTSSPMSPLVVSHPLSCLRISVSPYSGSHTGAAGPTPLSTPPPVLTSQQSPARPHRPPPPPGSDPELFPAPPLPTPRSTSDPLSHGVPRYADRAC